MEYEDSNPEILDAPAKGEEIPLINEMIGWWEKKRLIFNGLLILSLILGFGGYEPRIVRFGYDFFLHEAFFLFFAANFIYTLSWAPAALLHVLTKYEGMTNSGRRVLFIFGTLVSMFIAFVDGAIIVDGFVN